MLPENIEILGLAFDVVETPVVNHEQLRDGEIDYRNQVIRIDAGLSDAAKEQVLLHEIIHGVLTQLGFDEETGDERLVQGLAVGLHQALDPF